jgi:hypothetical protein
LDTICKNIKKFFYRNRVPWAKPENIKVDDSIMTVVIKTKGGRFIKNEIPVSKSLFGVVRLHYVSKGGVWGVAFAWSKVCRLGVVGNCAVSDRLWR